MDVFSLRWVFGGTTLRNIRLSGQTLQTDHRRGLIASHNVSCTIFIHFEGLQTATKCSVLRPLFEKARVIFTTIHACATCKLTDFFFPLMLKQRREGVCLFRPITGIMCRSRRSHSKSHLSTCGEKQLGVPDGLDWVCNSRADVSYKVKVFGRCHSDLFPSTCAGFPSKKKGNEGCEVTLTSTATFLFVCFFNLYARWRWQLITSGSAVSKFNSC